MRRLLIIAALLVAPSARAASWYVRSATACPTNGNGTASGCASTVGGVGGWRGFSNITWASIQAGDTLNLVGGDTHTGTDMTIGASGTTLNPITITVSGTGSVTLDGVGFNFNGHGGIVINGIRGNAVAGDTNYGIRVINIPADSWCAYHNGGPYNIKILHVECTGTAQTGTDDNRGGIYVTGVAPAGFEMGYNWIHGPAASSGGSATCFGFPNPTKKWCATCVRQFTGEAGDTSFTTNLTHDNKCDSMFNDGIGASGNVSVYNNEISNIVQSGHSDSVEIQGFTYVAVYNNYIHDSGDQNIYMDCISAGQTCNHVRIYNNVIKSNPGFGIVIDPETSTTTIDDVVIANNTFYSTSAASIRDSARNPGGTISNLVILNNIFGTNTDNSYHNVDLSSSDGFASFASWDYNLYSTSSVRYPNVASYTATNQTLAQLQALSPPRELHGRAGLPVYANPSVNDFHLAPSDTVATGKGVNLAVTYPFLATDKDGNPRSSSGVWDLGAYVTSSQPSPPRNLAATPR